jgi:phage host-nuclease inhibitor protein Gam
VGIPKVVLKGWDQVEEELGYLGELMAEQKKVDGEMQAKIAELTGEYAVQLSEIDTAIQTKLMVIEQFTRKNMDDIRDDGIMTKKFTTGVIKTKKVEDIEYPDNDELVEALKQVGLKQYIDTKEKPIKAAIKAAAKKDNTLYEKLSIDVTETVKVTIKPY